MSNKAELLKKIKALADQGVDGERESAQTLLARLMEQYGISETELEEERRETAWFPYSQETERRLLNQIIYMVTGAGGFGCVGTYSGRKRKKMGTECTAAERLEIEANYAFFRAAMEEELEIFYSAFACKNNLFPSEDKAKPRDIEELSPEEKDRYMKVGLMAEGMERHTLRKAIAAGETEYRRITHAKSYSKHTGGHAPPFLPYSGSGKHIDGECCLCRPEIRHPYRGGRSSLLLGAGVRPCRTRIQGDRR